MSRDYSVDSDRHYALARGFLDMINTTGYAGFELGRQWWWKVRLWQRGWITFDDAAEKQTARTEAVIAFAKELNEIIKAEVASAVTAELEGRCRTKEVGLA